MRNARQKADFHARRAITRSIERTRAHVHGQIFVRTLACDFVTFCSCRAPRAFSPRCFSIDLFRDDEEIGERSRARENKSRTKESNLALNVRTWITI